ncbi:MAG: hypothetical protein KA234_00425 [Saprospiraceae bacterium]|nr:hypothetical protein [Saprospiraceae bacterium]
MKDVLINDCYACHGFTKNPKTYTLSNGQITLVGYDDASSTYAHFDENNKMVQVRTEQDLLDIIEQESKKRYFFVTYYWVDKTSNGWGRSLTVTKNNKYINDRNAKNELEKDGKKIIITNITELSVQDYRDFLE